MGYDPRFRLHPVWMMWSYMQLEKLRNFQNTARIYRQSHADSTYSSATQWLRKSHYTNEIIIDEETATYCNIHGVLFNCGRKILLCDLPCRNTYKK